MLVEVVKAIESKRSKGRMSEAIAEVSEALHKKLDLLEKQEHR